MRHGTCGDGRLGRPGGAELRGRFVLPHSILKVRAHTRPHNRLPFPSIHPPIDRRKFLKRTVLAGIGAIAADSVLIAPNFPRVVRRDILLRRWPSRLDGFTIALLSDFHYDPVFSVHPIRHAVGKVNELQPDLVVLTGDFVTAPTFGSSEKAADAAEPCAELLKQLRSPHGLWAVLGNHDAFTDPDRVTAALQRNGIQVLDNQSAAIERDGGRFWLGGVDDILDGTPDLNETLKPVPPSEPVILLAHEPDFADTVASYPVDLQLSGHTHGGQIRLPFVPPLFLPELGRRYLSGLYRIGSLQLYTNVGLGTINIPARLNCPPEITLFTIRRSSGI